MIDKVVFVFLAALAVTTALDVPLGFELVGKKYVVSTAQSTFFEAFLTCSGHGYNMASITSAEENALLKSLLTSSTYYWIGSVNYDPIFDGNWFWIDTGANVNFTNWASTEPSLQSGINGIAFNSANGLWYAYGVSTSYRFVCEV